jgi:hypothetical protein
MASALIVPMKMSSFLSFITVLNRIFFPELAGQRHFRVDRREYRHDARASVSGRKALNRLRFVPVMPAKSALSS